MSHVQQLIITTFSPRGGIEVEMIFVTFAILSRFDLQSMSCVKRFL